MNNMKGREGLLEIKICQKGSCGGSYMCKLIRNNLCEKFLELSFGIVKYLLI
jgi:hypothetical protein